MFDGKIIIKIPKCVASNRPMLHPVTALGIPWHPLASLGIPWDPLGSLGSPDTMDGPPCDWMCILEKKSCDWMGIPSGEF
jgi:hypothetical protein